MTAAATKPEKVTILQAAVGWSPFSGSLLNVEEWPCGVCPHGHYPGKPCVACGCRA